MIWKYPLPVEQIFGGVQELPIEMPEVHRWLHVNTMNGKATIWADVDLETFPRVRHLLAVGTGFDPPSIRHRKHIGTAILVADRPGIEWLVVHIFDEPGTM
jgi:hypothetical protein